MKKLFLIAFTTAIFAGASAQSVAPQVVSAAGWSASGAGVSLSQTIGELTLVQTFSQGATVLTQGFQQPEAAPTGIADFSAANASLQVFPNPVNDRFHVAVVLPEAGQVHITITDLMGREVAHQNESLAAGESKLTLSATPWSAGSYFISVQFTSDTGNAYRQSLRLEVVH